ncbi:class I SAM-dependent methyltransferase, partial [Salmonella enterica subsp. enterica serovar Dublin]|nr:class I SAM-dependent methyltransferase [Salmonella enterica]EIA4117653.1 class I SAM-dependent methyltransferase [Salmonella enterica subsp. enterica serovar Dublin]
MYKEENKNIARKSVLKAAIEALTLCRKDSTLAPKDYIRKVKAFYRKDESDPRAFIVDELSEETIIRWEEFYDSVIQDRTARSIKVAYLSGPNPENDLTEMTDMGLLPENIWAFESDAKIYNEAVISALSSKFPFIKLIKANVGDFFEVSPQKFDLIYLDFCGPLPSKKAGQKTLKAITSILKYHALSPLGVMITNVSLPSKEQNANEHKNIVNLVASYLYPKSTLESNNPEWNCTDGAISEGYSLDEWHKKVECEIEDFYGQYITRLLVDLISVISPYDNFTSSHSLYKNMFKISNYNDLTKSANDLFHFDSNGNGGDIIVDSGLFPILWTIASIDKKYNNKDKNYYQDIYCDDDFNDYAQSFLSQMSANGNAHDLIKNISNMHFLLNEGRTEN